VVSRAVRRCGEILKTFDARPRNGAKQSAVAGTLVSQRDAAEEAGLSKRQQVTAVRVANVPVWLDDALATGVKLTTAAIRIGTESPPGLRALASNRGRLAVRAIKFVLIFIALAEIFFGIAAASALVARALRAQLTYPHRLELGVSYHGQDLAKLSGRASIALIGQSWSSALEYFTHNEPDGVGTTEAQIRTQLAGTPVEGAWRQATKGRGARNDLRSITTEVTRDDRGRAYNLLLQAMPTDSKIVLRTYKERDEDQQELNKKAKGKK
jgi:hypothetical protein